MTTKQLFTVVLAGAVLLLAPLSAQAQFDREWEFSAAQGDNPSYIGTDNDARSIAYGTVDDGNGNMVERVFVVSGGNDPYTIKVLDANDGTDPSGVTELSGVGNLPTPADGRKLTDVGVSDDGIIIACNEVNSTFGSNTATENFRCWRWDSLTASPSRVINYTVPDNSNNNSSEGDWVGRQFTVVGSAEDNSLTLLTSAAGTAYVYRFTTSDNGQSFSATAVERMGRPPSGNIVGVAPESTGTAPFFFNEGSTQPLSYAADGSERVQDPGIFSNFTWSLKYFEAFGNEWLTTFNWESGGSGQFAQLANVTNGLGQPTFYGNTPSLGSNSNINGTGDLDYRVNGDGTVTLFVIATNNGIGAYTTTAAPLPVEFASFEATQSDGAVQLTWTTASETNNAGFRVQHATGEGAWRTLGFVDSKAAGGSTTQAQSYRFAASDLAVGTHRFRLEQVDLDGTTHLSDVVTADVEMRNALRLSAPAPHPISGSATLSFAVRDAAETTVSLYNVLGQKVRTLYTGTPTAGERQTVQLSTDGLASGTYLLRMQADGATTTQKVTVLR
jgi:hypothetical protein